MGIGHMPHQVGFYNACMRLDGRIFEAPQGPDAGITDPDIDAAAKIARGPDKFLDRSRVGNVGLDGLCPATQPAAVSSNLFERMHVARCQNQFRPLGREGLGNRLTYTA